MDENIKSFLDKVENNINLVKEAIVKELFPINNYSTNTNLLRSISALSIALTCVKEFRKDNKGDE